MGKLGTIKGSESTNAQLVKRRLEIIDMIKALDYKGEGMTQVTRFNFELEKHILRLSRQADGEFRKGKLGEALFYQMLAETYMGMGRKENIVTRLEPYIQFIK